MLAGWPQHQFKAKQATSSISMEWCRLNSSRWAPTWQRDKRSAVKYVRCFPQRQERRLFRYNYYNRTLPSVGLSGCSNALLIPLHFLHIHHNTIPKSPRHISHHNLKPGCTIMPPSTTGGGGIVFSVHQSTKSSILRDAIFQYLVEEFQWKNIHHISGHSLLKRSSRSEIKGQGQVQTN